MRSRVLIALLLAGCAQPASSPQPTPSRTPPPAPDPAPRPSDPVAPVEQPKPDGVAPVVFGGDCSKGATCTAPATCVGYFGIAGARGPKFKTCEIKCDGGTGCPSGTTCRTVADGPGKVCR